MHLYSQFDSKRLGEAIVEWVTKRASQFKCAPERCVDIDLMHKSRITIQFNLGRTESIARLGFLNQHQSGSSGVFNPKSRREAEDVMTGLKMSSNRDFVEGQRTTLRGLGTGPDYHGKLEPLYRFKFERVLSLRPKSGLVIIDSNQFVGEYSGGVMGLFGTGTAVLKPEVKRRTLWVAGDSYDIGSKYSKMDEKRLNWFRGSFNRGTLPLQNPSHRYIEALIYGEVTFDDVDHFLVTRKEDAEGLKKFGKSIYLTGVGKDLDSWKRVTEPEFRHGRHTRDYLELLFEGTD